MNESQTYQEMLEEVESILKEIGSTDIDLDQMVTKVEKGYSLIQTMKERLEKTKEKMDQLHIKYDDTMNKNNN